MMLHDDLDNRLIGVHHSVLLKAFVNQQNTISELDKWQQEEQTIFIRETVSHVINNLKNK